MWRGYLCDQLYKGNHGVPKLIVQAKPNISYYYYFSKQGLGEYEACSIQAFWRLAYLCLFITCPNTHTFIWKRTSRNTHASTWLTTLDAGGVHEWEFERFWSIQTLDSRDSDTSGRGRALHHCYMIWNASDQNRCWESLPWTCAVSSLK